MMANVSYQGEVTEWFKVTVLKTVVGQLTVGSNPTPSANVKGPDKVRAFYIGWRQDY